MECGDVLLAEGHDILGVVTSEPRVAKWCARHSLQVLDAQGDYHATMAKQPFDYLFSITHLAIVPDDVLELPDKLAINFHDGPLPKYAGLNTPVWALLNREAAHGITWHVMTSGVDAGDLLGQAIVDIVAQDTALSLNTKCLAAALETFPKLVRQLADGSITRTRQDLRERTYFAKCRRPPAACAIDWSMTDAEVDAFVRALTFGPYPNPVGVPKTYRLDRPDEPIVVSELERSDSFDPQLAAPGTVLETSATGVTVATARGSVRIVAARTIRGDDLSPQQLTERLGLEPGVRLGGAGDRFGEVLSASSAATCPHEDFWLRRLASVEPPDVPQAAPPAGRPPLWSRETVVVPESIHSRFGRDSAVAVLAAFCTYLARTGRRERFALAWPALNSGEPRGWVSPTLPLVVELDAGWTALEAVAALAAERTRVHDKGGFPRDLPLRYPTLAIRPELQQDSISPVGAAIGTGDRGTPPVGSLITLEISEDGRRCELVFDSGRLSGADAVAISTSLSTCLAGLGRDPTQLWRELALVPAEDLDRQLGAWNDTRVDVDHGCVHEHIEAQGDRSPDAVAVAFRGESLTYQQLDERSNCLANYLRERGVGPDTPVGIHVERSIDLLVATLGVLKAGGAYVPLDPAFPSDRVAFMLEDSGARVLVTQSSLAVRLPPTPALTIAIDSDWATIAQAGNERPRAATDPSKLAYVIYTSGSTGKPKGVLVEHGNVTNFFAGMDRVVDHDPPGVWLAVTSLAFDISVLEFLWTLARGFTVVVYKDPDRLPATHEVLGVDARTTSRPMAFGLFMWGNDDGPTASKYDLMLQAAKYFDENGFDSAWTPERHFHAFGGPFPNPSVTSAALAVVTKRLAIRSGSCVSPLHHPIRIAEEWAVVDNLSNGRVGISFAAGWQPNDFVLRPESYHGNKQVMIDQIDIVRRLWRGEKVEFANPSGESVGVTTLPRPVQPELPFWLTTAGNPESYRQAGLMGANVLTHLLGQTLDEVAEKIRVYRAARTEAGLDPATGIVTLMLHTFVGDNDNTVRELVRQPMKDYLAASMRLVLGFAWAFPAFRRPGGATAQVEDVDLASLTNEEEQAILDFAFERYFETSGLFGTPAMCLRMVERCKAIDVDEIACLLDFGVDTRLVLKSLPHLKVVRDAANRIDSEGSDSSERDLFADQVRRNGVTHLQCTPSMVRMLTEDAEAGTALREIRHIMVGGEAFPPALAGELLASSRGTVTNMYGPTETTIWSSTHRLDTSTGSIPIGRPIANTAMYVLDRYRQPLPIGVPGDLYIGGAGVARGYHRRPDLTALRFLPDPFNPRGGRMYWTGDLARFRPDGTLDYLGRGDSQVKIRGYRIELGEIEAHLERIECVKQAAVTLREVLPGNQRLIAYVVPGSDGFDESRVRDSLRASLPEYMVPGQFVVLDEMPLTPNGKVDRNELPSPDLRAGAKPHPQYVEATNEIEKAIAAAWCTTLGLERVGIADNFFDVGGHSLLVVQLHRRLRAEIDLPLSLVDLYRFPTIRSLAQYLSAGQGPKDSHGSAERASKRKEALAMRRRLRT